MGKKSPLSWPFLNDFPLQYDKDLSVGGKWKGGLMNLLVLLKKFKKKSASSVIKSQKLENILLRFFDHPQHQWINDNSFLTRVLTTFFHSLDEKTIDFLYTGKNLILTQSNGKLSCTLSSLTDSHIIVVFPELYKLLTSCSPTHGLSILAHELGHIILEHTQKNLNPLEAQFEADLFAARIGYGTELVEVLQDYKHIPECKMRMEKLTQFLEPLKAPKTHLSKGLSPGAP